MPTIYWRAVHKAISEVTGMAISKGDAIGIAKRLNGEIKMDIPRRSRKPDPETAEYRRLEKGARKAGVTAQYTNDKCDECGTERNHHLHGAGWGQHGFIGPELNHPIEGWNG